MTRWDDLYFRINASDLSDPRWHHDQFGKQRVRDVLAAIKFLERHDMHHYNVASVSTAKLGTVVVGALAGKKTTVTADDFLPFDTRKIKKDSSVSQESLNILRRLMKTRKLDTRLIGTLANEIKAASVREEEQ